MKRLFSSTLCLVYFSTQCVLAHTTETNLWTERRRAAEAQRQPIHRDAGVQIAGLSSGLSKIAGQWPAAPIGHRVDSPPSSLAGQVPRAFRTRYDALLKALPYAYGTVRNVSAPDAASRTIIHIQDVHQNPEAQGNIAKTLQSLIDAGQVDLVALEGAFEPFDLRPFRDFPHPGIMREVADSLLNEKRISGPIYTALTSPRPIPAVVGIDDPAHYNANADAYRQSAPLMEQTQEKAAALKVQLSARKTKIYSPALLAFDQKVEAYHASKMILGDYVQLLRMRETGPPTPSMRTFLRALALESSLDFKKVESERAQIIQQLAGRLDEDEMSALLGRSQACRLGSVGYGNFYGFLRDLCRENHVSLADYKAMDAYIRYVMLSDQIQGEKLFEEIRQMERSAYDRLVRTQEEKELLAESKQLSLISKLLNFSLSPAEWNEYRKGEGTAFDLNLAPFESFYHEAQARDEAMAANLLAAMQARNAKTAVLVTGGFHAPGLLQRITGNRVSLVSFVPKLTKADKIDSLSVFTREKTPLEKLFEGQKLFLAEHPFSPFTQFLARLRDASLLVWRGGDGSQADIRSSLEILGFRPEQFSKRRNQVSYVDPSGQPWPVLSGGVWVKEKKSAYANQVEKLSQSLRGGLARLENFVGSFIEAPGLQMVPVGPDGMNLAAPMAMDIQPNEGFPDGGVPSSFPSVPPHLRPYIPHGLVLNPPWEWDGDYRGKLTQHFWGSAPGLLNLFFHTYEDLVEMNVDNALLGLVLAFGGDIEPMMLLKRRLKLRLIVGVDWDARRILAGAERLHALGFSPQDFQLYHADIRHMPRIASGSVGVLLGHRLSEDFKGHGRALAIEIRRILAFDGFAHVTETARTFIEGLTEEGSFDLFLFRKQRNGQGTAEYALTMLFLAAVLIAVLPVLPTFWFWIQGLAGDVVSSASWGGLSSLPIVAMVATPSSFSEDADRFRPVQDLLGIFKNHASVGRRLAAAQALSRRINWAAQVDQRDMDSLLWPLVENLKHSKSQELRVETQMMVNYLLRADPAPRGLSAAVLVITLANYFGEDPVLGREAFATLLAMADSDEKGFFRSQIEMFGVFPDRRRLLELPEAAERLRRHFMGPNGNTSSLFYQDAKSFPAALLPVLDAFLRARLVSLSEQGVSLPTVQRELQEEVFQMSVRLLKDWKRERPFITKEAAHSRERIRSLVKLEQLMLHQWDQIPGPHDGLARQRHERVKIILEDLLSPLSDEVLAKELKILGPSVLAWARVLDAFLRATSAMNQQVLEDRLPLTLKMRVLLIAMVRVCLDTNPADHRRLKELTRNLQREVYWNLNDASLDMALTYLALFDPQYVHNVVAFKKKQNQSVVLGSWAFESWVNLPFNRLVAERGGLLPMAWRAAVSLKASLFTRPASAQAAITSLQTQPLSLGMAGETMDSQRRGSGGWRRALSSILSAGLLVIILAACGQAAAPVTPTAPAFTPTQVVMPTASPTATPAPTVSPASPQPASAAPSARQVELRATNEFIGISFELRKGDTVEKYKLSSRNNGVRLDVSGGYMPVVYTLAAPEEKNSSWRVSEAIPGQSSRVYALNDANNDVQKEAQRILGKMDSILEEGLEQSLAQDQIKQVMRDCRQRLRSALQTSPGLTAFTPQGWALGVLGGAGPLGRFFAALLSVFRMARRAVIRTGLWVGGKAWRTFKATIGWLKEEGFVNTIRLAVSSLLLLCVCWAVAMTFVNDPTRGPPPSQTVSAPPISMPSPGIVHGRRAASLRVAAKSLRDHPPQRPEQWRILMEYHDGVDFLMEDIFADVPLWPASMHQDALSAAIDLYGIEPMEARFLRAAENDFKRHAGYGEEEISLSSGPAALEAQARLRRIMNEPPSEASIAEAEKALREIFEDWAATRKAREPLIVESLRVEAVIGVTLLEGAKDPQLVKFLQDIYAQEGFFVQIVEGYDGLLFFGEDWAELNRTLMYSPAAEAVAWNPMRPKFQALFHAQTEAADLWRGQRADDYRSMVREAFPSLKPIPTATPIAFKAAPFLAMAFLILPQNVSAAWIPAAPGLDIFSVSSAMFLFAFGAALAASGRVPVRRLLGFVSTAKLAPIVLASMLLAACAAPWSPPATPTPVPSAPPSIHVLTSQQNGFRQIENISPQLPRMALRDAEIDEDYMRRVGNVVMLGIGKGEAGVMMVTLDDPVLLPYVAFVFRASYKETIEAVAVRFFDSENNAVSAFTIELPENADNVYIIIDGEKTGGLSYVRPVRRFEIIPRASLTAINRPTVQGNQLSLEVFGFMPRQNLFSLNLPGFKRETPKPQPAKAQAAEPETGKSWPREAIGAAVLLMSAIVGGVLWLGITRKKSAETRARAKQKPTPKERRAAPVISPPHSFSPKQIAKVPEGQEAFNPAMIRTIPSALRYAKNLELNLQDESWLRCYDEVSRVIGAVTQEVMIQRLEVSGQVIARRGQSIQTKLGTSITISLVPLEEVLDALFIDTITHLAAKVDSRAALANEVMKWTGASRAQANARLDVLDGGSDNRWAYRSGAFKGKIQKPVQPASATAIVTSRWKDVSDFLAYYRGEYGRPLGDITEVEFRAFLSAAGLMKYTKDIHFEKQKIARDAGFSYFSRLTGHGTGESLLKDLVKRGWFAEHGWHSFDISDEAHKILMLLQHHNIPLITWEKRPSRHDLSGQALASWAVVMPLFGLAAGWGWSALRQYLPMLDGAITSLQVFISSAPILPGAGQGVVLFFAAAGVIGLFGQRRLLSNGLPRLRRTPPLGRREAALINMSGLADLPERQALRYLEEALSRSIPDAGSGNILLVDSEESFNASIIFLAKYRPEEAAKIRTSLSSGRLALVSLQDMGLPQQAPVVCDAGLLWRAALLRNPSFRGFSPRRLVNYRGSRAQWSLDGLPEEEKNALDILLWTLEGFFAMTPEIFHEYLHQNIAIEKFAQQFA